MAKTSSSDMQIQARQQDEAAEQSPPLITDPGGDQKAENVGGTCQVGGRRAEDMCRIDVRDGEERESGFSIEKVCRICHLGSDQVQAGAGNVSLVHLGCSCKGELGISHYTCAKAWFMQKGNRTCEICGKPAKNIEGVGESGVRAVVASEVGLINATSAATVNSSSDQSHGGCRKFLCNFLLAIVILAFLLPWMFSPSRKVS